MALDFPTPSNTGEIHNENGYRFVWDGSKWQSQQGSSAFNSQIVTGNTKAEVVDTGSDGHLKVTTEGTERFRIDSSGDYLFLGGTLRVKDSGNTTQRGAIYGDTSSFHINAGVNNAVFYSAGTERMRIDSSGNVGIGATSLNNKLEVNGNQVLLANGQLKFADAGNSHVGVIKNSGASGNGQLEFLTGGTPTERMRIDSSGNVGIGQNSPNALLEVNSGTAGNEVQRIEGNYSGSGSVVLSNWRRAGGAVAANLQYHDSSPIKMSLGTSTSHNFALKTGDTDRLTIDSSGNVGINNAAPNEKLHVGGNIQFGTNTTYYGVIEHEAGVTGANIYTSKDTGGHIFKTGTTPTEVLRIDNSGRLGVGTNSPSSYYANQLVVDTGSSAQSGITIVSGTSAQGMFAFADGTSGADRYRGFLDYNHSNNSLAFGTDGNERMRLDGSGRLLIGTTSAREHLNDGSDSAQVFIQGTTQNTSTLAVIRSSNNDGPAHFVLGKARGTGQSSTGVLQSGDTIGSINFEGADGSHLIRAAQISCVVHGTPGANDMPGMLKFLTTPDGSTTLTERLRIQPAGETFIKSSDHGLETLTSQSSTGSKYLYRASNSGGSNIVFNVWANGTVENLTGNFGQISDRKLKENIVDSGSQWDDVKAFQFRKFNFTEESGYDTHTQLGVIAQEIETVSPGLIYEVPDTDIDGNDLETVTKRVKTSILYMKAMKALQEAMERIETLETKVAALEAE